MSVKSAISNLWKNKCSFVKLLFRPARVALLSKHSRLLICYFWPQSQGLSIPPELGRTGSLGGIALASRRRSGPSLSRQGPVGGRLSQLHPRSARPRYVYVHYAHISMTQTFAIDCLQKTPNFCREILSKLRHVCSLHFASCQVSCQTWFPSSGAPQPTEYKGFDPAMPY